MLLDQKIDAGVFRGSVVDHPRHRGRRARAAELLAELEREGRPPIRRSPSLRCA